MRERLLRGEFPACMGRALETGEIRVTGAPANDCSDCPLSGEYGGRAGLTRRLEFGGVTYGVLAASVPAGYVRDSEEQKLFDELACDLAVGLHKIAMARRLEESDRSYRDLFEKHSAVKLIIDPDDGRIVGANAAAAKFYGWSRDELCRMKISDINTLTPAQVKTEMEKARALERTHFEFEHRRADGSIRDVALYSSRVESGGKELLYSVIHDITARKEALKKDSRKKKG